MKNKKLFTTEITIYYNSTFTFYIAIVTSYLKTQLQTYLTTYLKHYHLSMSLIILFTNSF